MTLVEFVGGPKHGVRLEFAEPVPYEIRIPVMVEPPLAWLAEPPPVEPTFQTLAYRLGRDGRYHFV